MAEENKEPITISWTATLLALPPIAVFFLSDMLASAFAWAGTSPTLAVLTPAMARQEAAGRLFVLGTAMASFAVVYLIVLRFASDLRDEFNPRTRAWLLGWYSAGLLVGAIWVLSGCHQVPLAEQLGKGFLKEALDHFGDGKALLPLLEQLALCSRIAFMFAAGIVVTGGMSALTEQRRSSEESAQMFLVRQRRRLRGYVNAAAALLVVALAFQIAWTRWPLAALSPADAKLVIPHIDAFAAYTGITGSLVILLFAAPVATILSQRAAALASAAAAPADEPLLDSGMLASLGKIFAVLAPTLAGLLPGILDLAGMNAGG